MSSPAALRSGLLLPLFILASVLVRMTNAQYNSDNSTSGGCEADCSSVEEGVPVPDPLDCHKFYACLGGDATGPFDCGDGQFFDETACVPIEGEDDCTPLCNQFEASCKYTCDDATGYKVDYYDCSSYYHCENENEVLTCQADAPFFDGGECQTDESKCCSCKPHCEAAGDKMIDPIDCTKYYVCLQMGEKLEPFSGECSGGNFDPFLGDCSSTVPCITLCTNVVSDEGCIDVFTCEETGYFPACPQLCSANYYHCTTGDVGSIVAPVTCTNNDRYNPDNSQCVPLAQCPYPEPGF